MYDMKPGVRGDYVGRDLQEAMALTANAIMGAKWHRLLLFAAIGVLVLLVYFIKPDSLGSTHYEDGRSYNAKVPAWRRTLQSSASNEPFDQTIRTRERLCHEFEFGGYHLNETGVSRKIVANVTSCLVHCFSPYVEREAAKRFVDPAHDNIFYANSPAVIWYKGQLVLVTRIWLERERYEEKKNWPANHFADNWLYTQKFDRYMRPVSNGSIIGIPLPKQWWVGDGPIEPRLVIHKGALYITFNGAMAFSHDNNMDFTIMWDYDQNMAVIPKIKGGSPMVNATEANDMPRDKHWMAFIQHGELYFVHNLDPLRVMHCTDAGLCEFVHNEKNAEGFIFNHWVSHLRGGTPFVLYEWPYYISVAHSTMYKRDVHRRFYTAHMVVMCVEPYRLVYMSNHIEIHPSIYQDIPMVRARYIDDGFIFPVGLILESKDSMVIGVHVNDHSSVLFRISGIRAIMKRVIKTDKRKNPAHGPPIGFMHKLVHHAVEKVAHVRLES
ncbi:hypothetical protein NP493_254g02020 [Ridgeia piscesae]|uniref:Uncharacterized protein n=1 Tax=Ridgeia piscesae TaxID=27915 RepID=A0AAD9NYD5_RIDPI|nr:hypothetical protein NP493_254g02020 [Ridgeia piscesae]